jgi:hypothetical protein
LKRSQDVFLTVPESLPSTDALDGFFFFIDSYTSVYFTNRTFR